MKPSNTPQTNESEEAKEGRRNPRVTINLALYDARQFLALMKESKETGEKEPWKLAFHRVTKQIENRITYLQLRGVTV